MIGGFEIDQLVLPMKKREKVMKISHESDWSMHYGIGKTVKRVQAYFYWPTHPADIEGLVRGALPVSCMLENLNWIGFQLHRSYELM